MNPRGMLTALSGVFIVAIVGVVIAIIALTRKPLITTNEIQDRTVQNSDLAGQIPELGFQLQNGQVLLGTLYTENIPESPVLGLSSGDGEVVVTVNDNGELTFLSSSVTVNSGNITDGSVTPEDLGFNVISSINGVVNHAGNVELVNAGNIAIWGNDAANTVALSVVDGSGSGLDADMLDGFDSSEFLKSSGGTISGSLTINNSLSVSGNTNLNNVFANNITANNFYGTLHGDINGCVTSPLGSQYCNDANITGGLVVNENSVFNNDLLINDDLTVMDNTFMFGVLNVYSNAYFWDDVYVDEDLNVGGSLDVDGDSEFDADLRVRDDLRVDDDLNVYGFANFQGNVYMDDNLEVDEDLFVNDDLDVDGNASINGQLEVDQDVFFNLDLDVDGSVIIDTDLTVRGDAVIGNNTSDRLTVNARISSHLIPSTTNAYDLGSNSLRWRNLFLSNTLTAADDVVASDDLIAGDDLFVGNDATVQDDLTVNDDASVLDDLDVGDNVNIGGALNVTGNATINAQLTVNDLVVNGFAKVNVFSSDLIPNGAGYDIGGNTLATRWDNLFITNIDASGNVAIGGTLALPGYADVKSELDSLNSDIATINAGLVTINAELLSLDSRLDELEIGDLTIGGVSNACNGSYGLLGADCTFSVALPAGKTLKSVSISPMGSGNPDVRVTIESMNPVTGAVGVRIAGQVLGTNVTGLSWVATLN